MRLVANNSSGIGFNSEVNSFSQCGSVSGPKFNLNSENTCFFSGVCNSAIIQASTYSALEYMSLGPVNVNTSIPVTVANTFTNSTTGNCAYVTGLE
eukprot:CAMPEP_0116977498 /NCGR_PEP_ID=MMETSP0467-20121206/57175_1 /TAXON_ID=283647 /ORGANISM="Mesodinium pulex, Strain SPMC105" /LENGTH=95 /DNA_ID=CAMNT_0004670595 /DNA_START=510 /DNA_END=797 /DNA_ORIENTATION=+